MHSLYEKIKIRLIILFLLAALLFIGLFYVLNLELVSDRAIKNAENRFELIEKNIGYFFNDIERDALTLKDSLYMLRREDEIIRAALLKMESMPYLDTIGLVMDNGKYLLFTRGVNNKINVYHQNKINGPLVDQAGREVFKQFNPNKRPWSETLVNENSGWSEAYNCFERPGKKCISWTLAINGKDRELLAIDRIHVDLNWRHLNEYLDKISSGGEVLFLQQGNVVIAKNNNAREKLIVYNGEGNYHIIDSNDTYYISQRAQVPNHPLFDIYFYYPIGSLFSTADKYVYISFVFIIAVLVVLYAISVRILRGQFSEMTSLVTALEFLPDSADENQALKIHDGDAKEIISIKNSIAEMKGAEIERSNKLLSLISYDQESGFIKNMAIIESNNRQYLGAGMIKFCGLESLEAVFGVEERNKVVKVLCRRIAEKFAQSCDIVTLSSDLYFLLCRENVRAFANNIALVETFEKGLGYRNIRIHNSAIYEFLKGEAAYGYVEKLKLALSSIRNHMFSEFILCDNDKLNEIEENIWISRNIRRAMKEGELFLVYQPIVDIRSQGILGAEALCRWVSEERGNISPLKFISIAEDIGFINELGNWIIETAMHEFAEFRAKAQLREDFHLHINVSPWQLNEPLFYERIMACLSSSGLQPQQICIEITETVVERINDYFYQNIAVFREQGFTIAIDDFGTGLSNLKRFYEINPDSIKIDYEFTSDIFGTAGKIIQVILDLAQDNHIPVVAEGVETPEIASALMDIGCVQAQGYLYQKPLPFSAWDISGKLVKE
ncbi:EAL domain-containing protein [Escherichia fergusonii]|uniref:EAL domain-containing protein n=5 Tax=Escherichia fergusonii TaxID=564 RepID=B7LMZ7_ESCF3|nr:EAL domain-containing protein [Escherichia fergusonii]EIH2135816.1 CHASE9 sensor domain-containing protein [Escherichia fergusonii]EIH2155361.1 CHASE9 sensor domain-containing protein [Escherichia fergusonii]EIH9408581.1 CHASE9 sensor domain-containing protein [Escherichia fergusonii]EIH9428797.1 CHASE9 sensor domain-containing protein [Escherichia fergusonii]QQC68500.1 CHASE9 sensor domain-containing protein [Escherichia fergusonii]